MRASAVVGRVGGLAVAMGVGVVVGISGAGGALAAPADSSPSAEDTAPTRAHADTAQRARQHRTPAASTTATPAAPVPAAARPSAPPRPARDAQDSPDAGARPAPGGSPATTRRPAIPATAGTAERATATISPAPAAPGTTTPAAPSAPSSGSAPLSAAAPISAPAPGTLHAAPVRPVDVDPTAPAETAVGWIVAAAARRTTRSSPEAPPAPAATAAQAVAPAATAPADLYAAPYVWVSSNDAATGQLTAYRSYTGDFIGPLGGRMWNSTAPDWAKLVASQDGKRIYTTAEVASDRCSSNSGACETLIVISALSRPVSHTYVPLSTTSRAGLVRDLAVSPDGTRVYMTFTYESGDSGRDYVRVFDTTTFKYDLVGLNSLASPQSLATSPDGKRLYVGTTDGTVEAIDTTNYGDLQTTLPGGINVWSARPTGATAKISPLGTPATLAVTPDGNTLYAVAARGESLIAIATDTMTPIGSPIELTGTSLGLKRLAISPDGARLYVPQNHPSGTSVLVLDTATNRLLNPVVLGEPILDVAVSPDGRSVWALATSDPAELWRIDTLSSGPGAPRVTVAGTQAGFAKSLVITPYPGLAVQPGGTCLFCNNAPFKGSATGYIAESLTTDFQTGVLRARVAAVDPEGDALGYRGYHIGPNGYDVVDYGAGDGTGSDNWATQFTTSKGGVVTISKTTGEFTYQPSQTARETAGLAGAVARDKVDTFGVSVYDREYSGAIPAGGVTVVPVTVPILPFAPALPVVSIANASVAEGNTGTKNLGFTVSLSKAAPTPVTVRYATANGTATAGAAGSGGDYTAASGTLTFAANITTQTVNVAILGDTTTESDETFTLALSAPTGATLGTATATATITNDDTTVVTPPTVSIADVSVVEGNSGSGNAAFTVSLSEASASPVTVGYATANGTATAGSDYTAASGTVTFAPGVTSQTVNVAVTGDTAVEPDETFTRALSAPTGATLGTATATATITNDDVEASPPGIVELITAVVTQIVEAITGTFNQFAAFIGEIVNSIVGLFAPSVADPASAVVVKPQWPAGHSPV